MKLLAYPLLLSLSRKDVFVEINSLNGGHLIALVRRVGTEYQPDYAPAYSWGGWKFLIEFWVHNCYFEISRTWKCTLNGFISLKKIMRSCFSKKGADKIKYALPTYPHNSKPPAIPIWTGRRLRKLGCRRRSPTGSPWCRSPERYFSRLLGTNSLLSSCKRALWRPEFLGSPL